MAPSSRVFELRTYHAAPGKLHALQDRFRNHALALFDKHGLTVIGFWTPLDEDKDEKAGTLIYLLAFESRDAAQKAWLDFRADPAWVEAKADSEQDGPLTTLIESVYLNPTDYSPLS
jgi:hypothetical protein